jgi:hypothetical protein
MVENTNTPPPPAVWHAGVDADTATYLTAKGWDKLDGNTAALEAVKAYREAERVIGTPQNKILRLPDDQAGPDAWKPIWTRLGAPGDPKGYDFSTVKDAKGQPLDPALVETLQNIAHANNLPKAAAIALAAPFVKAQADQVTATEAAKAVALQTQKQNLARDWGPNMEANKLIAQNAARALGLDPETVNNLENVIGYDKIMQMMHNIGTKIGEARFVTSNSSTPGVMSKEQAKQRIAELKQDKEFVTKLMNGDVAATKEMNNLHIITVGDDTQDSMDRAGRW